MIGIFDSWSGGLTFLAAMRHRHPEWSYIYHADYEHCPFWERSPEEIQNLTIAGVQKLFDAGASIVILACNTASAWTLRRLQTEVFPDKKILWVTIPWAEKVVQLWCHSVTVFATQQTVESRTYAERMRILDSTTHVREIALHGDLVREIEALLPVQRCHSEIDFNTLFSLYSRHWWSCENDSWDTLVQKYFSPYIEEDSDNSDAIILGCTHYPYLKKSLEKIFPHKVFIDPSEESADKLWLYLSRHPDILAWLNTGGFLQFI